MFNESNSQGARVKFEVNSALLQNSFTHVTRVSVHDE